VAMMVSAVQNYLQHTAISACKKYTMNTHEPTPSNTAITIRIYTWCWECTL